MAATTEEKRTTQNWSSTQAYIMAVICLIVGTAVGYLIRGSQASSTPAPQAGAMASQQQAPNDAMHAGAGQGQPQMPSPEQLKTMADQQAAPLMAKLKTNPKDPQTLAEVGNLYYDAQQFATAVQFYNQALDIEPKNPNVRTDLGTAYLYMNDPDRAIKEFETALKENPKHGQAMFNLGMAQWRAKGDTKAAVATWEKLLQTVPDFPQRADVEQMVAQAKKHMNMKPGQAPAKPTT
ncbi:Tetratricopeptide repeat protein [Candidatus Koribacter versatilis Ellin345]|uniref:Tetratricopeptide repeat protein n=1 Tax=Koribacter versatilis (strain Ellin345) TaxID=204669 RepID=Q1ITR3_KORVE|nr:tetratricopeptide repeat protein [Candidatus Koribacter versatilis]ABF39737.1 Tetratricopeptide repeat protein [Candidatus Koribacter versatilis Ellin345]